MMENGADMIDIGAESTRPKATPISSEEEWKRLEKILPAVISQIKKFPKKIETSIDSYHFETIVKSYETGVDVINDVSGLADERIVNFIAEKNIKTVLMHNAPVPVDPTLIINPHIGITGEILSWGRKKIFDLGKKGVKKSQLIFDPGIGFNKNAQQSIRILRNIDAYRVLGLPLYIGHSKKSFLEEVKIPGDRAEKTLVISKYLIEKKVDYLRIHDVKNHRELIKN